MRNQLSENPIVYTVDDLAKLLCIGRNSAYNLVVSEGFPVIRIGKIIRIEKESLDKWLKDKIQKQP